MAPESLSRTLVVVRHAKAEDSASTDHDRRLTDRGRADATALGESLGELLDPSLFDAGQPLALVSSAVRARETWAAVTDGLEADVEQRVQDDLYQAGPDEVVDLLTGLDGDTVLALVIGHNPTMEALAHLLDDGSDETLSAQLGDGGLSTAAYAVLTVHSDWADLEPDGCRLTHLGRGRG